MVPSPGVAYPRETHNRGLDCGWVFLFVEIDAARELSPWIFGLAARVLLS